MKKFKVLPYAVCNPKGKINLEKRQVDFSVRESSSISNSSEFEEGIRQGRFSNSAFFRGKDSKNGDGLSMKAYKVDKEVDRWVGNEIYLVPVEAQLNSKPTSPSLGDDISKGGSGHSTSVKKKKRDIEVLIKRGKHKFMSSKNYSLSSKIVLDSQKDPDSVDIISRSQWNLEEEITKVIEKGVSLGIDLKRSKEIDGCNDAWN
ncbi:hypothetical protein LWI29_025042 [Acer saccharum]|uniref:Uncharacterized protein n=1 Tax=Acer saccharum TaxID=4024 RepID=A0AA39T9C5_ACESA|nr:hypothetical protein LWI29_025042 [Acer saccharum]